MIVEGTLSIHQNDHPIKIRENLRHIYLKKKEKEINV